MLKLLIAFLLLALAAAAAPAADKPPASTAAGQAWLDRYFRTETARLRDRCLADVKTLEDWTSRREEYRRQLREMVGLEPMPERTPLQPVITGRITRDDFTVEKLYFQSRPHLYVTANLYIPAGLKQPAPAILYVCGHGNIKKDGVSYGSKTFYQHHGAWLARHGYVCMVIDTLELGELEGEHHGTYRQGMWWWNSRGYTPAGVEAWNGIRAVDYLQSRKEVDKDRIGITGRSGGGAYSWYTAALDERIKVVIPVAGITDLENHVVDGTVEGHCDCMFMVNTYRWDYPMLAALIAPRALLFSNSDKDSIFPLEGVVRTHARIRNIYRLYKAEDKLGLLITEGPHKDTQELQVPALHWFNRFLKGEDPPISRPAEKVFEPEQLRVFSQLPADQQNTRIHEVFVPKATTPPLPISAEEWKSTRNTLVDGLAQKCFRGWPSSSSADPAREVFSRDRNNLHLEAWDFQSQQNVPLRLYLAHRTGLERADMVVLNLLDQKGWSDFLATMRPDFEPELAKGLTGIPAPLPPADDRGHADLAKMFQQNRWTMAYLAPRGIGLSAWEQDPKKEVQIRRRFMLLGQTEQSMRIWDARRAVQALRGMGAYRIAPIWLQGEGDQSVTALYTAIFEPNIARIDLWGLPVTHQEGPDLLNVLKILDVPQAVALAAERTRVRIYGGDPKAWGWPIAVGKRLGWDPKQIEVRELPRE